ncbi:hypothetical protein [Amycolatopsis vastitatis]|uniref:Uncharacterized protein n=1 Tax=Amycolatopsis vastitatis TaxID=1905142 RepID=A0A229TET6_9PSEU|nr:hypothetical protein [Amycolatopsis vastitatis]OXM69653.1 hypothetical protein CF165_09090 [Amycolatopsis vastitatis]
MVSTTSPDWCTPQGDGPPFRWNISTLLDGKWSTQSELFGGTPDGIDVVQLLRNWHTSHGPDGHWRLLVTEAEDDDAVLAEVEEDLSGWVPPRQYQRLGKHGPPPAPSFWNSAEFFPPSARQLRARRAREQNTAGPPTP